MKSSHLFSGICVMLGLSANGIALAHDDKTMARPDGHAPIGVMRDHGHKAGEFMVSYRYGDMNMDGNRDGSSRVSTAEVLEDYRVAPTSMSMKMHMLGVMYGVSDKLTVAVMTGFADMEMDHICRNTMMPAACQNGGAFTMKNDGMKDTSVNALYEYFSDGKRTVLLNAGISLPTGSVDDRKPNGGIFAYPMQMGSGTYDLLPGISYRSVSDDWSWGGQANMTLRLGENDRDYTLGNRYQLTGWVARKIDMLSVSLRLDGQAWENVDGTDRDLAGPTFMAPPMDANLQAGERVDALIGANYIFTHGALKGHRLAVEYGLPLYENLDGPRLETDNRFTLGWQLAF